MGKRIGLLIVVACLLASACGPDRSRSRDDDPAVIVIVDEDAGLTDTVPGEGDAPEPVDPEPPSCEGGRQLCDGVCVDTALHPDHCGRCNNRCGEDQFCDGQSCQSSNIDCREEPCRGFTYCELGTGQCLRGCEGNEMCGANEACNLDSRDCVCLVGYHGCSGTCVDSSAPQTCGSRCSPCPSIANGRATCEQGQCGLACNEGYEYCGGSCVTCPPSQNGTTYCSGNTCMVACEEGTIPCSRGCCPDSVVDVVSINTGEITSFDYALDSNKKAHVAYVMRTGNGWDRAVYLAVPGQSGWTTSEVPVRSSERDDLWAVSLAFDATDRLHVMVSYGWGRSPEYWTWRNGQWAQGSLDGIDPSSFTLPIAFDSQGQLRAAFQDKATKQPAYATLNGSTWTTEIIPTGFTTQNGEASEVTFVLDGQNRPHLLMTVNGNSAFGYATKVGTEWVVHRTHMSRSFASLSITLDANGHPHMAVVDRIVGTPGFYATVGNEGIETERLPSSDPFNIQIVTDPTGKVRLLYINNDDTYSFPHREAGDWQPWRVTPFHDYSRATKLKFDALGDPHFMAIDSPQRKIIYAR